MILYSAIYPHWAHLPSLDPIDAWETVYLPEHINRKDAILLLHGGADISPSIYGEKPNKYVHAGEVPSHRDYIELALVDKALKLDIPIFGICRGAQLLCAIAGGKLVQHVTRHTQDHQITTNKGRRIFANSAHHQMMLPGKTEHKLLAWSSHKESKMYIGENNKELDVEQEAEIVYFPKLKALAVQGHPEWLKPNNSFVEHCLNLTKEHLLPHALG